MKKCKCLMCGGIYDLPQPKACPACGCQKFQSYFVKDPAPAAAKPASAPKSAPRAAPVAASRPAAASARPPAAKPVSAVKTASAAKAPVTAAPAKKFKPPKAPGKTIAQRFKAFTSKFSGMSPKDYLSWITRATSVLLTVCVFWIVYTIPAAILGAWWWGVLVLIAACFIVKKVVIK